LTEPGIVKGSELLRKLRRLGRNRSIRVTVVRERGKGSHVTVYFGDRRAVVPDLKKELKSGTTRAILGQLGVDPGELKG
jgi:mRNA interferase HicA